MSQGGGDRGQINFDFAVGVSILVITIVIAFSFIPGIFGGVTEGQQQSDKVVADRVAQWLVTDGLTGSGDRSELKTHCTNSLFSTPSELDHCGFTSRDINDNLPVGDDRFIHVSIVSDGTTQCWAGTDWRLGSVTDTGSGGCLDDYSIGNTPQESQEISVSRRAGTLGNRNVVVIVRVW